jgi:hypothetical protein
MELQKVKKIVDEAEEALRLEVLGRRKLTLKMKPEKSIIKKYEWKRFDALMRLIDEKKRII